MAKAFQTIPEAITAWALQAPDRVALLAKGREPISYAKLVEQAYHISRALDAREVTPSQRVALCIEDRPSLALCLIGMHFHGAPAIPLNPAMPAEELESFLTEMRADIIVCGASENTAAKAVGERLGMAVIEFERSDSELSVRFDDLTTAPPRRDNPPGTSDWALILATSGTTGRKIVPWTQGELAVNADRRSRWLGLGPQHRCMNVMPLYLAHGIANGLLAPLYTGGSAIIAPSSDTEAFFTCLGEYKPTWYTAVYTFHRAVMSQAAKHERIVQNASLSFLRNGGMHFPQQDVEEIEALFDAPLINVYGMTETGWIACTPLPPKARKAGTVGLQVIDEIKIIDENGAGVAAGQTGEIVVRGPGVMKGYIDNPEANAEAFIDGWFRTGDLGFFDEDGYLTIAGRIKEIINQGAEKISPWEVEMVLAQHPNVEDIAVFGAPHRTLGEVVAAAIVFKDDRGQSSQDDITKFAKDRLSISKVPRRLFPVASIPKGPGGKPQRKTLSDELVAPNRDVPETRR